jgi:hypothetical protein
MAKIRYLVDERVDCRSGRCGSSSSCCSGGSSRSSGGSNRRGSKRTSGEVWSCTVDGLASCANAGLCHVAGDAGVQVGDL